MVQAQAEGEFNKKFRKSDEFKKNLPEEKVKAFGDILKKFFDSEAEDYKKEEEAKTPDYEGLIKKAGEKKMDFSLKNKIIEVDRDADRRYAFAAQRIGEAERAGEKFPQSSPMVEKWVLKNDDDKSHEINQKILEFLKKAAEDKSVKEDVKPMIEKVIERGIPAKGEPLELTLPQVLVNQVHHMTQMLQTGVKEWGKDKTEAEVNEYVMKKVPEIGSKVIAHLTDKYVTARDEIENEVDTMKTFFRSQKEMPGKTKADVLKEIWAELPKVSDKPVPPLDEEMLAELAEEPAVIDHEFRHSWGTADVLYKSEAIDAFGSKYLLGVFETKDEAQKAFNDWNAEYEKARVEMKAEMEQWGKQEQARLDRDTSGNERIKAVLEEARR